MKRVDRSKTPAGWWIVRKRKSGYWAIYEVGNDYREAGPFPTKSDAIRHTWDNTPEFIPGPPRIERI